MRRAVLLAIAAALELAAPGSAQEVVDGKQVYRTAEASIWTGEVGKGTLVHKMTGTAFPETIEGYKRTDIFALAGGEDVGVNYESGDGTVTIYLFRPSTLPEHKLKGAITSFALVHPTAFVWSSGPFDVEGPQKLRMLKATYKTGVGSDTVMDYLYFGELGRWTVKVRATMKKAQEPTERAFDKIVRTLPWTTILQANGSCDGTACTAQASTAFDYHFGELMLTSLIQREGSPAKAAGGPLFSRKAGSREWRVDLLDGAFAALFTNGFGTLSIAAPIYTLSWEDGRKKGIVRFFNGTPDEALFNREVDSLVKTPEETAFVPVANAVNYVPY